MESLRQTRKHLAMTSLSVIKKEGFLFLLRKSVDDNLGRSMIDSIIA